VLTIFLRAQRYLAHIQKPGLLYAHGAPVSDKSIEGKKGAQERLTVFAEQDDMTKARFARSRLSR
jgi:hypothetical protein